MALAPSAPHQIGNNLLDKLYALPHVQSSQNSNSVQSFREKIENLIPSVAKLLSSSIPPVVAPAVQSYNPQQVASKPQSKSVALPPFIDCWTSTATAAGQSSRTRVLNILKDGTYTFWEELIMEPEPLSSGGSGVLGSSGGNNGTEKRRGSIGGRRGSLGPPKFRMRKSSGEWRLCVNQGVTLLLLNGEGTETSGECGDYEENISPRGVKAGEKWHHEEPLAVEHIVNDWSSVSEDKVTELLC